MVLGVPVPNAALCLTDEVKAALIGQVSEVANNVCNGMFVTCAAAHLESCYRFGGPSDVVGFVDHARNPKVINAKPVLYERLGWQPGCPGHRQPSQLCARWPTGDHVYFRRRDGPAAETQYIAEGTFLSFLTLAEGGYPARHDPGLPRRGRKASGKTGLSAARQAWQLTLVLMP